MAFSLRPTDLDYLSNAPCELYHEAIVAAPPEPVFELLTSSERMGEWFPDFVSCTWETPAPHGVGSRREVVLKALRVKERFLAWEAGSRVVIAFEEINLPLVSRLAEDMRVVALDSQRTRVSRRVAYTPTLAMRLVHPLARVVFGRMFAQSLRALADRLAVAGR